MTQWDYGLSSLGGVATAGSSEAGWPPTNANDGSDVTYWRCQGYAASPWLKIDLQTPQYIEIIGIKPHAGNGTYTVLLQWSTDGTNWNTLVPDISHSVDTDYPTGGITARYWRVNAGGIGAGEWYGVYSFRIWGPIEAPPPLENPTEQNVTDWLDSIDDNIRPIIDDWLTAHGY